MTYSFEGYVLDPERMELRKGGILRPVEPQVFDLLQYLLANRDRVVSRDEIFAAVWKGRVVSESTLSSRINAARAALGDSGDEQRLIRTHLRKGVRFIGKVREAYGSGTPIATSARTDGISTIAALASDRAIVVLPFHNLSDDPKQEYFVDGVTESLTTDLSRIMGLHVIARNTAFTFKGKAIDVKQIARDLNVRYVLEGSLQRGGDRVRVNVQLIDAETGNHVWAERFDKPVADLFDMQDEIVSRLANTLNTQLVEAEARRVERSLHPDAMDLNFQGMACLNKGATSEFLEQAQKFFERALALDPNNVEALVGMARAVVGTGFFTDDQTERWAAAEAIAIRAVSLAPNHAAAHRILGFVQMNTNRAALGIAQCQRALALDRNSASAHGLIGCAKIFMGRGEETEAHVQEALRLSPGDQSVHFWMLIAGLAKLQIGADEEAVARLRSSVEINRNQPRAHFYLAAALAHLGRLDEARSAMQSGVALDPTFTLCRFRINALSDNPAYLAKRERLYEGMRLVGVPEG